MQTLDLDTLKVILSPDEYRKILQYVEDQYSLTNGDGSLQAVFDGGYESEMYGSFYIHTETGILQRHSFPESDYPYQTNNVAEYLALIELLNFCIQSNIKNLEIYGDSQLVINQVNGKWKSHKEHLTVLRDLVLSLLDRLDSWSLTWARRDLAVKYLGH